MNEDEAFIRAIEASPDDDTIRLVYADWLDEQRYRTHGTTRVQRFAPPNEIAQSSDAELRRRNSSSS